MGIHEHENGPAPDTPESADTLPPSARTIPLSGLPGTASRARSAARAFLAQLGHVDESLTGTAELVVSELVTNAVRHAPGPCVLDLEHTGAELRVTVHDHGDSRPSPRPRHPERPAGHGLEIVRSVSARLSITSSQFGNAVTAWLTVPGTTSTNGSPRAHG